MSKDKSIDRYQNLQDVVGRFAQYIDAVDLNHLVPRVDQSRTVRRTAVHHTSDDNLARPLVRLDRRSLSVTKSNYFFFFFPFYYAMMTQRRKSNTHHNGLGSLSLFRKHSEKRFFYILKVNFCKYKFDTYQWLVAFDQLNNFDRLLVFIGNIERRLR